MAEFGFYHLTRSRLEQALPRLLGRTLAAGQRAVVLCGSPARVAELDAALWECDEPDWLPHGTAETGDADLQPIWLTTSDEAPNGARFLFQIDDRSSAQPAAFERIFDLFDGNDSAAVEAARVRWRLAKEAGHGLAYWQQSERGWERKR